MLCAAVRGVDADGVDDDVAAPPGTTPDDVTHHPGASPSRLLRRQRPDVLGVLSVWQERRRCPDLSRMLHEGGACRQLLWTTNVLDDL